VTEAGLEESRKWVESFRKALKQSDPKNILPGTYISLTPPGDFFGEHVRFEL
jgi:hypothetical protein